MVASRCYTHLSISENQVDLHKRKSGKKETRFPVLSFGYLGSLCLVECAVWSGGLAIVDARSGLVA